MSGVGKSLDQANRLAVYLNERGKIVIYSNKLLPKVAIVDPELTYTLPPKTTAYTGMDALTHAIEAFLSINGCELSDANALKAIELIYKNLPVAYKQSENKEARYNMSLAATLAGEAMTNSGTTDEGCPMAGAGLAHMIGLITGSTFHLADGTRLPHGLAVGMTLPAVLAFHKRYSEDRLKVLARSVAGTDEADGVKNLVEVIMNGIDMKSHLHDYTTEDVNIDEIANAALKVTRLFKNLPSDFKSLPEESREGEARKVVAAIA